MTAITKNEVLTAAHNAAFIANCPCPARYAGTPWRDVWVAARKEKMRDLGLIK
jgi:hypothetical protein